MTATATDPTQHSFCRSLPRSWRASASPPTRGSAISQQCHGRDAPSQSVPIGAHSPQTLPKVCHMGGGIHQALLQMVVTRSTARSLRSEHKYIFQARSLRQKAAHITSHSLSRRWLRTCSDLDDLMGTTGDASEESDDMSACHLDMSAARHIPAPRERFHPLLRAAERILELELLIAELPHARGLLFLLLRVPPQGALVRARSAYELSSE